MSHPASPSSSPFRSPGRAPVGVRRRLAAAGPASPPRAGFTLTELLVASVILAVGLLALVTAGAAIVRLDRRGRRLARAAAAAESRLEILRVLGCGAVSGAGSTGGFEEQWSARQVAPRTVELSDSVVYGAADGALRASGHIFRSALHC